MKNPERLKNFVWYPKVFWDRNPEGRPFIQVDDDYSILYGRIGNGTELLSASDRFMYVSTSRIYDTKWNDKKNA